METAERELYRAKEKYRKDNTERENAKRRDEHYLVGEKVLCYNRLVGDEQDPSKLKLRTAPPPPLKKRREPYHTSEGVERHQNM